MNYQSSVLLTAQSDIQSLAITSDAAVSLLQKGSVSSPAQPMSAVSRLLGWLDLFDSLHDPRRSD